MIVRIGSAAAAASVAVVAAVRPDDRAVRVGGGAVAPVAVVAAVRPDDRAVRVGGGQLRRLRLSRPSGRMIVRFGSAAGQITPVAVETPVTATGSTGPIRS